MNNVKIGNSAKFVFFLLSVALAVFLFPPNSPGSGVFYVSALFFFLALFLSSYKSGIKEGLSYLRLSPKKGEAAKLFLWGIAAFFLIFFVALAVSFTLSVLGLLDTAPVLEKVRSLSPLALFAAVTIAPLGEEAIFRGWLFRKIGDVFQKRAKNGTVIFLISALLSSLVFSAFHFSYGSFAEFAVVFFVGLALCFVTQKSGSLVPAIIAHAFFNLLSIVSSHFSLVVM